MTGDNKLFFVAILTQSKEFSLNNNEHRYLVKADRDWRAVEIARTHAMKTVRDAVGATCAAVYGIDEVIK